MTEARYAYRVMPAESPEKRMARMTLYQTAQAAPRYGHAVTLAGAEPEAEAALLLDYLHWQPNHTWFVDWAKEMSTRQDVIDGLTRLRTKYPKAHAIQDNVVKVIQALPVIGFANLDFMGQPTRTYVQPALRETCKRLATGGIVGLTFYRGRESCRQQHGAYDVWQAAGADPAQAVSIRSDDTRWLGVCNLVAGIARSVGCNLKFVRGLQYQHRYSPMAMAIWQRE